MNEATLETMPDGSTYANVPVLWARDGGLLEPGTLVVYVDRGPIRWAATGALISTSEAGPLRGWGQHDCEISAEISADECAWSCRLNLDAWRDTVLRLANDHVGDLHDYKTGDCIRAATAGELAASIDAAKTDGGAGVIAVEGRSCYVI